MSICCNTSSTGIWLNIIEFITSFRNNRLNDRSLLAVYICLPSYLSDGRLQKFNIAEPERFSIYSRHNPEPGPSSRTMNFPEIHINIILSSHYMWLLPNRYPERKVVCISCVPQASYISIQSYSLYCHLNPGKEHPCIALLQNCYTSQPAPWIIFASSLLAIPLNGMWYLAVLWASWLPPEEAGREQQRRQNAGNLEPRHSHHP